MRQTLIDRMAAHGFVLEGTGGNCEAFIRRTTDVHGVVTEEYVTTALDPSIPDYLHELVSVGTYELDEDGQMEDNDTLEGYTMADVLAALGNPAGQYARLAMRLYNDLHREG